MNLVVFLKSLWSSCLDACRLIYNLTIVCLPHTTITTSFLWLVVERGRVAAIMSLLVVGSRRSWRVRRAASTLTATSRQRRWVSSVATCPINLGDNNKHEDREQTYVYLPVYTEMKMKLSMTTETKNLKHKSCVKQCAEATHERKF
jgi:hypothetical protein